VCGPYHSRENVELFDAVTIFGQHEPMTRVLTPEEEEIAYEHAISGVPRSKTAEVLGFVSRMAFHRYCLKHPEFARAMQDARSAGNIHTEDEIRHVTKHERDPQLARVKMEALCRLLQFSDPTKYGNKVDITMNQTVSVRHNLDSANNRVAALMRDVTPLQIEKPNEINDLL
jgi:hypothetical protein